MNGFDNVVRRIKKNLSFTCSDGETFEVWNDAISYQSVLYRRELLQSLLQECGVAESSSKMVSQNIIDKKKEIIKILSGISKIDVQEKMVIMDEAESKPEPEVVGDFDQDSIRVIKVIRKYGGRCLKSKIMHDTRMPTTRIKAICHKLCKKGTLVQGKGTNGHGRMYALA